jgi:hypothetical protein
MQPGRHLYVSTNISTTLKFKSAKCKHLSLYNFIKITIVHKNMIILINITTIKTAQTIITTIGTISILESTNRSCKQYEVQKWSEHQKCLVLT